MKTIKEIVQGIITKELFLEHIDHHNVFRFCLNLESQILEDFYRAENHLEILNEIIIEEIKIIKKSKIADKNFFNLN